MSRVKYDLLATALESKAEDLFGGNCFKPTTHPECAFKGQKGAYSSFISQTYRLDTSDNILYFCFRNGFENGNESPKTRPSSLDIFIVEDREAESLFKIHFSNFESAFCGL